MASKRSLTPSAGFEPQPAPDGLRSVSRVAARRRSAAQRDARSADRDRVQSAAPADQRGRQRRGGVPHRVRRSTASTRSAPSMLGLTLECARCHDHKFDPITQRDYYSLFAFFNSIDESGLYSHFTNATPSPSLLLWRPETEARHAAAHGANRRGRSRLAAIARGAQPAFNAWRPAASVKRPAPIAHLALRQGRKRRNSGQRSAVVGAGTGRAVLVPMCRA